MENSWLGEKSETDTKRRRGVNVHETCSLVYSLVLRLSRISSSHHDPVKMFFFISTTPDKQEARENEISKQV